MGKMRDFAAFCSWSYCCRRKPCAPAARDFQQRGELTVCGHSTMRKSAELKLPFRCNQLGQTGRGTILPFVSRRHPTSCLRILAFRAVPPRTGVVSDMQSFSPNHVVRWLAVRFSQRGGHQSAAARTRGEASSGAAALRGQRSTPSPCGNGYPPESRPRKCAMRLVSLFLGQGMACLA